MALSPSTNDTVKVSSTLELNGFEKLFCLHGNWLTVCHVAQLSGDSACLTSNIDRIIPRLLKRHTRLRSRVRIDGYKHYLDLLEYDEHALAANLFYSIVYDDADDGKAWQRIAEERSNRNPYSPDGSTVFPLFHFALVLSRGDPDRFHLILLVNHCASDGQSGYVLLNQFLSLATSSTWEDQDEPLNKEVLPCIANMIPKPLGPAFSIIASIGRRWYKRILKKHTKDRIPAQSVHHEDQPSNQFLYQPVRTQFLFASSRPGLSEQLRGLCRTHRITLHGPLLASLLLAVHHVFPSLDTRETTCCGNGRYLESIDVATEINMRPRLTRSRLTLTSVGFYVGSALLRFDSARNRFTLRSTTIWDLAKRCLSVTRKAIERGEVALTTHMFQGIIADERVFTELARLFPSGRMGELNFSNVGQYPYSNSYNQGQIKLDGLHVTCSNHVYQQAAVMFASSAGDDGHFDFSLAHEIETDEQAKYFLKTYVKLVEAWAESGAGTTLENILEKIK